MNECVMTSKVYFQPGSLSAVCLDAIRNFNLLLQLQTPDRLPPTTYCARARAVSRSISTV